MRTWARPNRLLGSPDRLPVGVDICADRYAVRADVPLGPASV